MASIESRLRKLEQQQEEGQALVVLFGDDPLPPNLSPKARIFRFDSARRPEIYSFHFPEEDRDL